MTAPILIAEIAFDQVTYIDVAAYVRRFNTGRGRQRARDRIPPGTATIVLLNDDGRFDRENSSGPYYPNVRPNRPIRLKARTPSGFGAFAIGGSALGDDDVLAGGTVDVALFAGRTEGGPQESFENNADTIVTWAAVDDSKRLNRDRSTSGFGSGNDLTGIRVNDVLDGATPVWPASMRDIDAGQRTVAAPSGTDGRYDYLLQVAESEGGAFFLGADGKAVFRDSAYAPVPDTQPFGDIAGEQRYRDISIDDDDKEIFNFVAVTAPSLADQTAEDGDSQAEFGRSDLSISTSMSNTVDMDSLADDLLSAYSQPRRRVGRLVVGTSGTKWRTVLSKELLDRVTARYRPRYGGMFEQLSVIQGIAVEQPEFGVWIVTWALSPPVPAAPDLNLLTANQASIETDATGWTVESGCTIARSTAKSFIGAASLEVTTTGAIPVLGLTKTTPVTTAAVVVGETYRAVAYVMADAVFQAAVHISWRDSGGSEIGTVAPTQVNVYPENGWVKLTAEGAAPANTTHAVVRLRIVEPYTNANIHYADAISLRRV